MESAVKTATRRLWCQCCEREVAEHCEAGHHVTCLKKARVEEAGQAFEGLRKTDDILQKLDKVLVGAQHDQNALGVYVHDSRKKLEEARSRLEHAQDADRTTWDIAKWDAARSAVPSIMGRLLDDLADPSATCSVLVRLGRSGQPKWLVDVAPAEETVAKLLLCQQAAVGHVREQHGQAAPEAARRWTEARNEVVSPADLAAAVEVGCRVGRGRDWKAKWVYDGTPPGPGTVLARRDEEVRVRWDRTGITKAHFIGTLRLLARPSLPELVSGPAEDDRFYRVIQPTSCRDLNSMTELLTNGRLARVRAVANLPCSTFSSWSVKVLEQVAPHLEALHMVSPQQRHMDVVATMPHLQALSLVDVTAKQLQQVVQLASLRRLDVHCSFDLPLPECARPATAARLQWLRCGVYPLAAALALAREHAESLEELQLVAASTDPYGCPDLARELQDCGLRKLKTLVLLRDTAYGAACRHDRESCFLQAQNIWKLLSEHVFVRISCSLCDSANEKGRV